MEKGFINVVVVRYMCVVDGCGGSSIKKKEPKKKGKKLTSIIDPCLYIRTSPTTTLLILERHTPDGVHR